MQKATLNKTENSSNVEEEATMANIEIDKWAQVVKQGSQIKIGQCKECISSERHHRKDLNNTHVQPMTNEKRKHPEFEIQKEMVLSAAKQKEMDEFSTLIRTVQRHTMKFKERWHRGTS